MRQTFPSAIVAPKPVSPRDHGSSRGVDSFRKWDQVVLIGGPYWGTRGIFLRLTSDVNWADLEEHNGSVRCHPLASIAHSSMAAGVTRASER